MNYMSSQFSLKAVVCRFSSSARNVARAARNDIAARQASRFTRLGLAWLIGVAFLTPAAHGAIFEFPSAGGITINDNTNATPYPSTITASGVAGTVTAVRVKLNGFSHTRPDDVDVFLVAPSGQVCAVLSDAGGGGPGVTNVNLVFDDAAGTVIPDNTAFTSGSYRPSNYEPGEPQIGRAHV